MISPHIRPMKKKQAKKNSGVQLQPKEKKIPLLRGQGTKQR
jgi:hypothetical protein